MKLIHFLTKPVDPIHIALWRIVFGLVLVFESFGANLIGWTKLVYIDPPVFTFNFIGFEWLQPLPGNGMYWYFAILGTLGILITLGWYYRTSIVLFTIGWAGVYLMHKTSYNNHHYLMLLLCLMMCFTPADAQLKFTRNKDTRHKYGTVPNIFRWQFLVLFLIVYFYASIAKIYPDWLSGKFTSILIQGKQNTPVIGWLYRGDHVPYVLAYGGILYDLLVIPALLWRKTRTPAFIISLCFHLYNSITLQIGTFPYMMIGASVLFFPADVLRKRFRLGQNRATAQLVLQRTKIWIIGFAIYFAFQIGLPLRNHLYNSNVFWSEEGHRLSWRMMLRQKSGRIHFRIFDKEGELIFHTISEHLSEKQQYTMATRPDMIWQYCQYLKTLYGNEIVINAVSFVSLNGRRYQPMIDPQYDMAKAEWHRFKHSEWILPFSWHENEQTD